MVASIEAAVKTTKRKPPAANNLTDFCKPYPAEKKRKKANTSRQPTQPQAPAARNKDPVVQVINGELVLQQQHETTNNDDERSLTVVVEEQAATTGIVAASYSDFKFRTGAGNSRWTAEETDVFYSALRQVGLDFGTMEVYFEGRRNRRQLKRKYYSELKRHPDLVEKAMQPAARVKIDLQVFELTEKTLQENIEEEKERKRLEEEEEKVEAKEAESPEHEQNGEAVDDGEEEADAPEDEATESVADNIPLQPIIDEFTDPAAIDPLMEEEEEHEEFLGMEDAQNVKEETQVEEEPTLSLVHVDKPKKAKAKPRFRTRKAKK